MTADQVRDGHSRELDTMSTHRRAQKAARRHLKGKG